ncbi:MAG: NTP transferase domain-containing protein [Candidatus Coatesbacteria bacterium]|nr:NTP transferase domain-containing protein [Candidatus Coatesbacteria bacterium]
MKGIILAGGLGSRLDPLTRITNKHLLPIYDKPMIHYPLEALIGAGISDILIVTGGKNAGHFLELLGNGSELGLPHLNYTYQKGEGGIAEALSLARHFVGDERMCVILGDNILERSIAAQVAAYRAQPSGARILLKEVPDPERFGVPVFDDDEKLIDIEEKPARPRSNYAVIGVYFYDSTVFEIIDGLEPSARGELEITDVNNHYLQRGELDYGVIEGWWTDAGTFPSLLRANNLVEQTGANNT